MPRALPLLILLALAPSAWGEAPASRPEAGAKGSRAVVATGAADDAEDEADAPESAVEAAERDEDDKVLRVQGAGKKTRLECKKGQDLEISGASHNVSVTGECRNVSVQGAENTVILDQATTIVVAGVANSVSYRRGPDGKVNGKAPRIKTQGVDVKVVRLPEK